jgi:hypothetical protein
VQLYRYFVSQSNEFYRHNPLYCFSTGAYCCCWFRYRLSPETFGYSLVHTHTHTHTHTQMNPFGVTWESLFRSESAELMQCESNAMWSSLVLHLRSGRTNDGPYNNPSSRSNTPGPRHLHRLIIESCCHLLVGEGTYDRNFFYKNLYINNKNVQIKTG